MSKFNQLLSILNKEFATQQDLQQVLKSEQIAIKKYDQQALDSVTLRKSSLVRIAEDLEKRRSALLLTIEDNKNSKVPITLKDIIDKCKDIPLKRNLSALREKLRSLVIEVQSLNLENQRLLRESVSLIATAASLFQQVAHESIATYSAQGAVKGQGPEANVYGKTRARV